MNLLTVFCYITVTCEVPPAARPAQTAAGTGAVATPSPPSTTGRSPAVALSVDGGGGGGGQRQQQLLQGQQQQQQQQQQQLLLQRQQQFLQQQQQLGKTVRQTEMSTYPTRYDYIDVEAVMNNERIVKILFNCVLNRGPCTREGLELKRIIPDAIQTECAKCSERQKKQAGKALAHLLTYKPEYWKTLVQKFDPNNVYLRRFMADDDEDEINSTSKTNL